MVFGFSSWPLRAKLATLLLVASMLPLAVAAVLDIRESRARMVEAAQALLTARGDQLAGQLDTFHRGYQRSVERFARLDAVAEAAREGLEHADPDDPALHALLVLLPNSDANVRGTALIDRKGRVRLASEAAMVGVDLSYRSFIQRALRSNEVVTADIYRGDPAEDLAPTIAYLAPLRGAAGEPLGLAAFWVKAAALWDVMKAANELAGPGSFAVLFDGQGIRIAHTFSIDQIFRPAGPLDPATVDALVAERRFGEATREILEDVRDFPEQFERARAAVPDEGIFRGFAPINEQMNLGVGRRFAAVPWTVFYMLPERSIEGPIGRMIRHKILLAGAIMLFALVVGLVFGSSVLRSIAELSRTTQRIAVGELAARAEVGAGDELGRLADSFNTMAQRIQEQAEALQAAQAGLERKVRERTAELTRIAAELEGENAERKNAENRLHRQLARLALLNHITRAIAERQDVQSIFQVVIRSVEDSLEVDFSCVCRYDPVAEVVVVDRVGVKSPELASELASAEHARVDVGRNGLSRALLGHLVYEPEIDSMSLPFVQRLARAGLHALVVAPLVAESSVFGLLIVARRQPGSFSSADCEFLKQLGEHVALASHQAQLHDALQRAYDDLRQTQQAILQQERLRALGQMASGIAHDINNAIAPIGLYAETLAENEPVSERGKKYLQTIQLAVDDVAETVSRLREFYREHDPQLTLSAVDLDRLVDETIELSRARWSDLPQRRGIMIELRRERAGDLPLVAGVASELREALINLVFNAVDAMPDGGTLTLRTGRRAGSSKKSGDRGQVEVQVADTGVGMTEDARRRCLEPFFTTKGERGTGLGLAMVYGIVERHGADLDIDSELGRGTTVTLRFPVPAEAGTLPKTLADVRPSRRLRLLVIDDDPVLVQALRDFLEGDGHEVATALGGADGIASFKSRQDDRKFDAVIVDLGMPYVDGRQVSSAIKGLAPATPVILLTGWGQRLIAEGDVPPHVDRLLSKPPRLRDLRAALAALT
jgi:signal transduction histidine kinase/ActR/RegA family two-component response regulator/HAMP domain-containing protein